MDENPSEWLSLSPLEITPGRINEKILHVNFFPDIPMMIMRSSSRSELVSHDTHRSFQGSSYWTRSRLLSSDSKTEFDMEWKKKTFIHNLWVETLKSKSYKKKTCALLMKSSRDDLDTEDRFSGLSDQRLCLVHENWAAGLSTEEINLLTGKYRF